MAVFGKDSEVYDAVMNLQAKVDRLLEKTGLAAEDKKAAEEAEAAAKKAEEVAAKAAEEEAAKAEAGEDSEPAPTPAPGPRPATTVRLATPDKPPVKSGPGSS